MSKKNDHAPKVIIWPASGGRVSAAPRKVHKSRGPQQPREEAADALVWGGTSAAMARGARSSKGRDRRD